MLPQARVGENHTLDFLGYSIASMDEKELQRYLVEIVEYGRSEYIAVMNANKLYLGNKFDEVDRILKCASVLLPENAINIAMNILGNSLPQANLGGLPTMERMLSLADERSYTVFFLGASRSVINRLVEIVSSRFPNLKIQGAHDGYFADDEERGVVKEISDSRPNFLFVGMGSPKQELFIAKNIGTLNANISIGVGGSFKVLAGVERAAPQWTKHGLEWLYRSFQDPRKFVRYAVVNTYFLYRLVKHILFERNSMPSS